MTLNPKTKFVKATLIKGTSLVNKAGRFENGKPLKIENLEHAAWLKPKPQFQVLEFDENNNIVGDTLEARREKPKAQRIVKMKQEGDGWGEVKLDDEAGEEARKQQAEAWQKIEAEWAEEERAAKEEEKPADPADDLAVYPEEKPTAEQAAAQAFSSVFPAPEVKEPMPWKTSMKISQLKEVLKSRGVDTSELRYKRDLIQALEATEE